MGSFADRVALVVQQQGAAGEDMDLTRKPIIVFARISGRWVSVNREILASLGKHCGLSVAGAHALWALGAHNLSDSVAVCSACLFFAPSCLGTVVFDYGIILRLGRTPCGFQ